MRALVAVLVLAACGEPEPVARSVDVQHSSFTIDRTTAVAGVDTVNISIALADSDGAPVAHEQVALSATGDANTLPSAPPTNAAGHTASTWTSTKAELKTLTATLSDGTQLGQVNVMFVPGPPAQLRFTAQPAGAEAGGPISAAVGADDQFGNPTASNTTVVMLQLATNPTATVLNGMTALVTHQGIASFDMSQLTINVPGTYTLGASAFGVIGTISDPFTIVPGDPAVATSTISAAPHSNDADGISLAAIAVHVRNQYGIDIAAQPLSLAVSGTGNVLTPTAGATASDGTFAATLSSTVGEVKTITATVGPITLSTMTWFYAPACTLQLPWRPHIALPEPPAAFIVADVDGNGVPDSIESYPTLAKLVVRRGRGDGRFFAPADTAFTGQVNGIYAKDFTGDGQLDLVVTVSDSANAYALVGNGNGTFAAPTVKQLPAAAQSATLAELTGDANVDLVISIGGAQSQTILYPGLGNGTFGTAQVIVNGIGAGDVLAVNLDGAGGLDLVVAHGSVVWTYLGGGNGTFGTPRSVAPTISGHLHPGDFNGDGKLDVVVIEDQLDIVVTLLGAGDGSLTLGPSMSTSAFGASAAVADFNSDGKLDLVVGAGNTLHRAYVGNGDGSFTHVRDYSLDSHGAIAPRGGLYAADADGDGRLDLITANVGVGVTRGLAGGTFAAPALYGGKTNFLFDVSTDFNSDGVPDLFAFDTDNYNRAWLTQPDGSLVRGGTILDTTQPAGGAAADVNNDGKQDIAVLHNSSNMPMVSIGFGQANGTFSIGPDVPVSIGPDSIVLAKLDADSIPDLVLLKSFVTTKGLYVGFGSGTGSFGSFTYYPTSCEPVRVIARDADNDGDRDLIVAERIPGVLGNGKLDIFPNSGNGTFGSPSVMSFSEAVDGAAAGDFDGDATLDYAVLTDKLHIIKGGATLTAIGLPYDISFRQGGYLEQVEAVDLDNSGTLDLVIEGTYGFWVLQGYGDGYFRRPRYYGAIATASLKIGPPFVLADRNSDGAVDLSFSGRGIAVALQRACLPFTP